MLAGIVSSIVGSTVGSFLQVGISKLIDISLVQAENINQKLERMERTLSTVRSLIHCTDEVQIAYQEWKKLLQAFEDAVYSVEDLMDLKKMDLRSKLSEREIDGVQTKLKDISKDINRLRNPKLCKPETSYTMDGRHPLGRDSDIKQVIAMLDASDQPSTNLTIISIHGIIGVGKTTLAQVVYNRDDYKKFFDYRIWISVPTNYDTIELTQFILDEVISQSRSTAIRRKAALSTLQGRLMELLQEKKLLLVLDDVCNFNREEWDVLLNPLRICTITKIIVTTGSPVVSKQLVRAYKGSQYDLERLGDKDCCQLLTEEVREDEKYVADLELKSIGMEIAKKCKGIPLAAKIIGGLLAAKVDAKEWKSILKIKIFDNRKIKGQIVSAVRWGYCSVPLRLRQAFAYCSMFPIFHKFEKDKIIRMWMGEGLIIPDQDIETLEDAGSSYVDQLLENSFLQIDDSMYIIQESVHELAQSISGKRFLQLEIKDNPSKNTRHLLLTTADIQKMFSKTSNMCTGIRTLLLPGKYGRQVEDVRLDLLNYEKLRVLDLSGTQITELTECIGNWKHLRFLDLSNTLLKLLPGKIVNLCMLQTLRLINCSELLRLPANIGNLGSLRHLELGGNSRLSSMPSGIGNLTSLQTINDFIVGAGEGQLKELENMNNIRGSLCIKKLENAQDSGTESGAKLADKSRLDKLELQWTTIGDAVRSEKVLGLLMKSPHRSLKELLLTNYSGASFPGWIGDPLSAQLTTICFNRCPNCVLLPCLGKLPNLKTLEIIEMPMLNTVDEVFLGRSTIPRFPCLETLKFCDLSSLESWVDLDESDMPLLRVLSIVDCPLLNTIPSLHHLRSLEELEFTDTALEIEDYFTPEQLQLRI